MGARRRVSMFVYRCVNGFVALAMALLLASCDAPLGDYQDPAADLTRDDFENMLGSSNMATQPQPEAEAPPIPDLVPTLVAPVPPSSGEDRLVSISVTDSVPIRSVLLELARAAEVDLELDPSIKPFIDVIDRIANMANLRYSFKNGVLRVELDRPYHRTYRIDQIAALRDSASSIDISTDVFSAVGDSQTSNGSAASINQSTTGDFYTELEDNVRQILENTTPGVDIQEIQLASTDSGTETDAAAATTTPTETESFSLHRQGGLLSVYATQRQHKEIQDYLLELLQQVSSQVLVEAKVLEVNLNDEFRSGIDWSAVANALQGTVTAAVTAGSSLFAQGGDVVGVAYNGTDVSGVLALISQFGTTRTLANPRLAIGNNQPAILKVAQNQVYFTITFEEETTDFGTTQTFDSQLNTVPVGLVMVVQPSINLEEETVTMSLRPTLSRIIGFVDDPAVSLASNNTVVSQVPITEVREMDSIVSARSGEVVIMGGLMQEVSSNDTSGVPGFQDVPWVGNLFKSNDDDREVIELVIFLKATIVRAPLPDAADIDLYSTFAIDPRPLTF
jgi:MSHA biogenesis protein MshL